MFNSLKELTALFKRLWHYFFAASDDSVDVKLKEQQVKVVEEALKNKDNPFLFGYATYVALYADQEEKATYYKNINRVLLILLIVFASLFGIKSCSSKIQPFVVGVNENGQVFDMNERVNNVSISHLLPKLSENYMQNFIRSAFSISADGDVLRANLAEALSMTRGNALETLIKFYDHESPKKLAKDYVITVKPNYIMQASKNTFKVGWTETKREIKTAKIISSEKYYGEFTYSWDTHSTEKLTAKYNPLGFYIDSMSWSQSIV